MTEFSDEVMYEFRLRVEQALGDMNAPEYIHLIQDAMIRNALRINASPEDVAWAIIQ